MKKLLIMISLLVFVLLPFTALAGEGPMKLPAGANAEANKHNEEGITHWDQGHFDVASSGVKNRSLHRGNAF
jgi:hypothetical protein